MTAIAGMNQPLLFPPIYTVIVADQGGAFDRAMVEAASGAGAATLVWSPRDDLFDCAVVLEPDRTMAMAQPVLLVAALATADALGALGPPNKPITFDWPDRIAVDGGQVGGLRLGWPDGVAADAVPDWLVVGVTLRFALPTGVEQPGRSPDRTALLEEGFGDVTVPELVESFSRHFLHWTARFLEDGFEPVAQEWLGRLPLDRRHGPVRHGLDPDGDLLLLHPGRTRPERLSFRDAVATPGWSL